MKLFFFLFFFSSSFGRCVDLDVEGANPGTFNLREETISNVKVVKYTLKEGHSLDDEVVGGLHSEEGITKVVAGSRHVWEAENGPVCRAVVAYFPDSGLSHLKLELHGEGNNVAHVHYELEKGVFVPITIAEFEAKLGHVVQRAVTLDISGPLADVGGSHDLSEEKNKDVSTLKSVLDGVVFYDYEPKRGVRIAKVVDGTEVLFRSELVGCASVSVVGFNGEKKFAHLYIPKANKEDADEGKNEHNEFVYLEKGDDGKWTKINPDEYQEKYRALKASVPAGKAVALDLENPDPSVAHINVVKEGKMDARVNFPLPGHLVNEVKHGDATLWKGNEGERCLAALATAGELKKAVVLSYRDKAEQDHILYFLEQDGNLVSATRKEMEEFMKEVDPSFVELPLA